MVHHGRDRMQIAPWKSRDDIANLVPFPDGTAIDPEAINAAIETASAAGFISGYTAALLPSQAAPFIDAGFELFEELHLLRCRLSPSTIPEHDRTRLRRGRRGDFADVLELDGLAFDQFWQFDRASLADSMRATPRHRFQVTRSDPVCGYHITGLAGTNAYLQRVAVHPDSQRQGWGICLVGDSMRWAHRQGARTMHVNTQLANTSAVALYERCGFELAAERLHVLHRVFGADQD